MKVRIKKLHPDAVIPKYAHPTDAGMDLTAVSKSFDEHGNACYGTGLAFEIPKGFVGLLFPRSSNSKQDLLLSNSVGVIDSGYIGEVMMKFKVFNHFEKFDLYDHKQALSRYGGIIDTDTYEPGDRIGQLIIMPYPTIEFEECDELSNSERGAGGYGSTGK